MAPSVLSITQQYSDVCYRGPSEVNDCNKITGDHLSNFDNESADSFEICDSTKLDMNGNIGVTENNEPVVSSAMENIVRHKCNKELTTVPRPRLFSNTYSKPHFSYYVLCIKQLIQSNPSLLQDCKYMKKIIVHKMWKELYDYVNQKIADGKLTKNEKLGFNGVHKNRGKNKSVYCKNIQDLSHGLDKWLKNHATFKKKHSCRNYFYNQKLHETPNSPWKFVTKSKNGISVFENNQVRDQVNYLSCNYTPLRRLIPLEIQKPYVKDTESEKINYEIQETNAKEEEVILNTYVAEHDYCMKSKPSCCNILLHRERSPRHHVIPSPELTVSIDDSEDELSFKNEENIEVELCDLYLELESLTIKSKEITNPSTETVEINNKELNEYQTCAKDEKCFNWQYCCKEMFLQNKNMSKSSRVPESMPENERRRCINCQENLSKLKQHWAALDDNDDSKLDKRSDWQVPATISNDSQFSRELVNTKIKRGSILAHRLQVKKRKYMT